MKFINVVLIMITVFLSSCGTQKKGTEMKTVYNLIKPSAGIYEVYKKNVKEQETAGNYFEKNFYENDKLLKIERYDKNGNLTDELFIPAITKFEYDNSGKVKYVKYFGKNGRPAETPKFGYSSIEYIYDGKGRVIIEIYRNKNFNLLSVPRTESGEIKNKNFISPVLAYIYNGKDLTIKAFDKNFNLIKETKGKKPCVPFIDCGE